MREESRETRSYLLFRLIVRDPTYEIKQHMLPEKQLFAHLYEFCAISMPDRARTIHDLLGENLFSGARIHYQIAKPGSAIKRENDLPELDDVVFEIWNTPRIKILEIPSGTESYEVNAYTERLEGEQLNIIYWISDLRST